ncbi:MAG: hypothetical protein VX777_02560 [Chlamydiota bacterium]|nr:hypothetical protein [Chlamydiota bacterium]
MAFNQLKYCGKILEDYAFSPEFFKADKEIPYDYYRFNIGPDNRGRSRFMIVNMLGSNKQSEDSIESDILLQLSVIFPFKVSEGAFREMARVLMFFNRSLDIPGFGMDELSGHIYFRYAFMKPEGVIPRKTFLSLISIIMLAVDSYSEDIEAVASGLSVREVMQNSLERIL